MLLDNDLEYICQQQARLFKYAVEHGANVYTFANDFLSCRFCERAIDIPYSVHQYDPIIYWVDLMAPECVIREEPAEDFLSNEWIVAEWMGYMYRYLAFQTGKSSKEILAAVSPRLLARMSCSYGEQAYMFAAQEICERCGLEILE